ncbi:MAG: hypothetical protein CMJ47_01335 [Planctomyces sp.]|nr:hypothetical protein [Planctomyces sp.]
MSEFGLMWLHLQWFALTACTLMSVVFVQNLLRLIIVPRLLYVFSRSCLGQVRPRSRTPRLLEMPGRTQMSGDFPLGSFRP